jgi:hypothetical protein
MPNSARLPVVLGLTAVAVLLAIVVAASIRSATGGSAVASPTPSPSAAGAASTSPTSTPASSASAAASPSASVTAAKGNGYVTVSETDKIAVRRERDASVVFELAGRNSAVSTDGRRIAYWRVTSGVGATDLNVVDAADPSSDRSVYHVPSGFLGGSVVWSNDGLGLLITTYSLETVGSPGGPPGSGTPAQYLLLMVDLATTPATATPAAEPATKGFVYVPVGWDRPGRIATGVITGEGGFTRDYVIWNGNSADRMSKVPLGATLLAFGVQASPDAKLVLGWELSQTPSMRVWPIDDPSRARTIAASGLFSRPFWRTSSEFVWTIGRQVQLVRVADGSATTVYTGPSEQAVAVAARADGSALVVEQRSGPPGGTVGYFVVDLTTRQAAEMWSRPGPGSALFTPRGVIIP